MANIEDFLTALNEEADDSTSEDTAEDTLNKGNEDIKIIVDSASRFKARITKPIIVKVEYKYLASSLKDAVGISMTREKAKTIFNVVKNSMGL